MHENLSGVKTMQAITIFAVIVLYKVNPEDCVSLQSLLQSYGRVSTKQVRLEILLFDNTPARSSSRTLPPGVTYHAANANVGLADAYNYALQLSEGFDWLLTLDQDTTLPETFIENLSVAISAGGSDHSIGAIVPQIVTEGRMLSPNYFVLNAIPRFYAPGYVGVARHGAWAFNSASLLRTSFLRAVGGYNTMFWLDYCDAYIYSRLKQHGMRVYVAGNIQVEHEFALFDIKNSVSLDRYRNVVEAGSAFWDMEFGLFGGLYYTASLVYRIYNHWRRGDDPAMRHETIKSLKQRIFLSKSRRLSQWKVSVGTRLARNASQ